MLNEIEKIELTIVQDDAFSQPNVIRVQPTSMKNIEKNLMSIPMAVASENAQAEVEQVIEKDDDKKVILETENAIVYFEDLGKVMVEKEAKPINLPEKMIKNVFKKHDSLFANEVEVKPETENKVEVETKAKPEESVSTMEKSIIENNPVVDVDINNNEVKEVVQEPFPSFDNSEVSEQENNSLNTINEIVSSELENSTSIDSSNEETGNELDMPTMEFDFSQGIITNENISEKANEIEDAQVPVEPEIIINIEEENKPDFTVNSTVENESSKEENEEKVEEIPVEIEKTDVTETSNNEFLNLMNQRSQLEEDLKLSKEKLESLNDKLQNAKNEEQQEIVKQYELENAIAEARNRQNQILERKTLKINEDISNLMKEKTQVDIECEQVENDFDTTMINLQALRTRTDDLMNIYNAINNTSIVEEEPTVQKVA